MSEKKPLTIAEQIVIIKEVLGDGAKNTATPRKKRPKHVEKED